MIKECSCVLKQFHNFHKIRPVARISRGGYLKNQNQIMLKCYAIPKPWVLRGSEGMFPGKKLKFEVLELLEIHRNCQSYHRNVILYLAPFLLHGGCACPCETPPPPPPILHTGLKKVEAATP